MEFSRERYLQKLIRGKAEDVILNPKAPYPKRLISDVPKIHEPWDLSTVG